MYIVKATSISTSSARMIFHEMLSRRSRSKHGREWLSLTHRYWCWWLEAKKKRRTQKQNSCRSDDDACFFFFFLFYAPSFQALVHGGLLGNLRKSPFHHSSVFQLTFIFQLVWCYYLRPLPGSKQPLFSFSLCPHLHARSHAHTMFCQMWTAVGNSMPASLGSVLLWLSTQFALFVPFFGSVSGDVRELLTDFLPIKLSQILLLINSQRTLFSWL